MCLYISREKTRQHSKVNNKQFIFYKLYKILHTTFTIQLYTLYRDDEIKTTIVKAKGDLDLHSYYSDYKYDVIEGGCIHAWTNPEKGNNRLTPARYRGSNLILLSIQVHSKDIIAYGTREDVCFFKYEFTEDSIIKLRSAGINLKQGK